MIIDVNQLRDIMMKLEARKERMEKKDSFDNLPPKYVGVAIYSDVIKQLKGLMPIE